MTRSSSADNHIVQKEEKKKDEKWNVEWKEVVMSDSRECQLNCDLRKLRGSRISSWIQRLVIITTIIFFLRNFFLSTFFYIIAIFFCILYIKKKEFVYRYYTYSSSRTHRFLFPPNPRIKEVQNLYSRSNFSFLIKYFCNSSVSRFEVSNRTRLLWNLHVRSFRFSREKKKKKTRCRKLVRTLDKKFLEKFNFNCFLVITPLTVIVGTNVRMGLRLFVLSPCPASKSSPRVDPWHSERLLCVVSLKPTFSPHFMWWNITMIIISIFKSTKMLNISNFRLKYLISNLVSLSRLCSNKRLCDDVINHEPFHSRVKRYKVKFSVFEFRYRKVQNKCFNWSMWITYLSNSRRRISTAHNTSHEFHGKILAFCELLALVDRVKSARLITVPFAFGCLVLALETPPTGFFVFHLLLENLFLFLLVFICKNEKIITIRRKCHWIEISLEPPSAYDISIER